jgi:hypothetical protein
VIDKIPQRKSTKSILPGMNYVEIFICPPKDRYTAMFVDSMKWNLSALEQRAQEILHHGADKWDFLVLKIH